MRTTEVVIAGTAIHVLSIKKKTFYLNFQIADNIVQVLPGKGAHLEVY